MIEVVAENPIVEKMVDNIASYYDTKVFHDKDVSGKYYVYIDNIEVLDEVGNHVSNTGRGITYSNACEDLMNIYHDPNHRLRFKSRYATEKIHNLIVETLNLYKTDDIDNNENTIIDFTIF